MRTCKDNNNSSRFSSCPLVIAVKDRFGDQDDEGSSGSSDSESDDSEVVRMSDKHRSVFIISLFVALFHDIRPVTFFSGI